MALFNKSGLFKIDGTTVMDCQAKPGSPYELYDINKVGIWYRNINATRTGYLIANMKKLYWSYVAIPETYMNEIMAIINAKIEGGSDMFMVTSWMPGIGNITDKYYLGDPHPATKMKWVGPGLYSFDIHWVQNDGKKSL